MFRDPFVALTSLLVKFLFPFTSGPNFLSLFLSLFVSLFFNLFPIFTHLRFSISCVESDIFGESVVRF